MKRILILVAGATGAAGLIAMAAPASADSVGDGSQLRQFQQTVQSESKTFTDSIGPGKAVNEFLNGSCTNYPNECPVKDMNPGVLNQFDVFQRNLQSQSKAFGDTVDPTKQLGTFAKSITDPSSDPAKG